MREEKPLDAFLPDEIPEELDLADQANWEDNTIFISLEEAGLEEQQDWDAFDCTGASEYNRLYWDDSSSELTEF